LAAKRPSSPPALHPAQSVGESAVTRAPLVERKESAFGRQSGVKPPHSKAGEDARKKKCPTAFAA
jgi:hypothetical protein